MKKISEGLLVEIDISDLVWDEQTEGTYEYAVDKIDAFIDEISDCNKIIPHNFKEVNAPSILISLNNKLISHVDFKAIGNNGKPRIVNIDKSGSNNSAILTVNKRSLSTKKIKIRKVKYLNNIIEQDHRRIKRRIRIMTGFKEFESAQRTLSGIEVVSIIKKDQIINPCSTSFKTFCSLVA